MTDLDQLIIQLGSLGTEQINPRTTDIDLLSAEEIALKINDEDQLVASVVKAAIPIIARVAENFAATIRSGGQVFYIGAGTSGRLGVLDAAECPPTFGSDPKQIKGLIAGGYETMILSREGVEDNCAAAVDDLKANQLTDSDYLIGLAASSRTPYTLAALEFAKSCGCRTALITCTKSDQTLAYVDQLIELPVGPEVITGSTRMKSGTAQKMALNMISTTAMILLGKTFGNLMVDLQARSEKLTARSRKILIDIFDLSSTGAEQLLAEANGSVKLAMVMHKLACDAKTAQARLDQAEGFTRRALAE